MGYDVDRAQHGLGDGVLESLEVDRLGALAHAGRVIDAHAEPRVGETELARERALGIERHPDHVGAVATHALDFGRGLEARPLRGGVDALFLHGDAEASGGHDEAARERTIEGPGHVDVTNARFGRIEVGHFPPPGVVDQLIGHGERPRSESFSFESAQRFAR